MIPGSVIQAEYKRSITQKVSLGQDSSLWEVTFDNNVTWHHNEKDETMATTIGAELRFIKQFAWWKKIKTTH